MINFLRGILVLFLITLLTVPMALLIIICGLIVKLIPAKKLHQRAMSVLMRLPQIWIACLNLVMHINGRKRWQIRGNQPLDPKGCYILISNHRSWVDILVLNSCFNRKIPMIKFFMKEELKWQLPIAGLACWVMDYPFMKRHTRAEVMKNPSLKGKDVETTRKACQKLRENPSVLVNFIEGTRFTAKKHERQQSPFKNLLKPRAGGLAIVVEELNTSLRGIIDATLCYPDGEMTFWKFVTGDFSSIILDYRVIKITPDLVGDYYENREFRAYFQSWLNTVWQEKDKLIESIYLNS